MEELKHPPSTTPALEGADKLTADENIQREMEMRAARSLQASLNDKEYDVVRNRVFEHRSGDVASLPRVINPEDAVLMKWSRYIAERSL